MNGLAAAIAGCIALAAAGFAVTRANAVHALLGLVTSLLSLAVAFFALGAGLAAVLMILIYAGAIVVVFVFVVMTLDTSPATLQLERAALARTWGAAGAIAAVIAAPFAVGLGEVAKSAPVAITVKDVGMLLFGPWAITVELASFLLLAGLLGVRHLGWRPERKP